MNKHSKHCTPVVLSAFLLTAVMYLPVKGDVQPLPGIENTVRSCVLDMARRYLGVRYRLGGHSPRGFDCSGLVYYVFGQSGITIPRTAVAQYKSGRQVGRDRLKPGDLVFFSRRLSRPTIQHVGIYAGDNRFIHAPSFGLRVSFASMKDRYWKLRYLGAVTFFVAEEDFPKTHAGPPAAK
jgi:hypothetical protein